MAHREDIRSYFSKLKFQNCSVVDWGCGTKPVDRYGCMGENVTYVTVDKLEHVGADIVLDVQDTVDLGRMFDVAVCLECIEHVPEYNKLLDNIYQHLHYGGTLYMSVPFLMEVHHQEDYWRFTDIGLKYLLEKHGFTVEEIVSTENNMGWIVKAKK